MNHSFKEEEEDALKEKAKAQSACPWDVDYEDESRLMLCFFIVASKVAIFLKHLDSSWLSFPQKLQCHSIFVPFDLVPFSFLEAWVGWEGLGPLFCLLLRRCCFLGCLDFSFYCATKDFLDVSALLIIPICMSLSCSLINESQKH